MIAAIVLAGPAQADALQDKLLAGARAVPEQGFTRNYRSERRGAGTAETDTRVDRYDPSKPEGQRWTLLTADGKPPSPKQIDEHARVMAKTPAPGYWRLARWIGGKATTTDGRVYRYASLPKGAFTINGHDLSADTAAEVTVNREGATPWVERVRLTSSKGFRMMLVVKIEGIEAVQTYRMDKGRPVLAETATVFTGSMMGKSGTMRSTSTFDYR